MSQKEERLKAMANEAYGYFYDVCEGEESNAEWARQRSEAQAIIDYANYQMGEHPEAPKRALDPWGAPVDMRGM